ncbi:malonyl-CoA decarboxylase, mitochondrial-like isoform X2 [Mya arenaria]|uniref:malonyl-CoA decarboxylase, mitochondrial-like isoform X2 n=1 Tax=Mya arenaria TaxID=6604 RepID=UPI0022E11F23|nr:malonyl-CoA decarboxylase, mitochondrial-like isoform X2 [Mya arenaria]
MLQFQKYVYQMSVFRSYCRCVSLPSRGEQVMTTVKPATRIDRTYARCYSNGTGSSLLKDELKFLQSFYASETHGVLSIESGCRRFCELYRSMDAGSKMELLRHIAENYGVDQTVIVNVAQRVIDIQTRGDVPMLRAEERLKRALTAKYQLLFTDIGRLEGGVKFLADMRADILWLLSKSATSVSETDRAHLTSLQLCLKELLSLWFTMGFLRLERLTWQSPCDVLQKISEFEAVHPVRHWADLKRRVGPYRRCFVFTHTSMPREPIVVLHTALTGEISSSIDSILERPGGRDNADTRVPEHGHEDPNKINTAMFYSVTSTQKGLHGVDLGNYLIKRAAGELAREWPQITQFSSISPIPGFREWLLGEINRQIAALNGSREGSAHLLTLEEVESICSISNTSNDILLALLHVKELINDHIWTKSPQTSQTLKPLLMRLCSQYLYKAKRRGYALNSVANFHLQNGAVLWRLNWAADMTSRGLENSCGLMANYRYFLNDTVTNSQRYIESGYICASEQVLLLCG